MNFVPGAVENGTLAASGNIRIQLPKTLNLDEGRLIICGVRPDKIEIADSGIAAEVIVVEPTGSETQLLVRVGNTQMVCVSRDRLSVRAGDTIHISLRPEDLLLFDQETEQPISIQYSDRKVS
jgi:multiple sugar transport system ATP-binding protein